MIFTIDTHINNMSIHTENHVPGSKFGQNKPSKCDKAKIPKIMSLNFDLLSKIYPSCPFVWYIW